MVCVSIPTRLMVDRETVMIDLRDFCLAYAESPPYNTIFINLTKSLYRDGSLSRCGRWQNIAYFLLYGTM
jgi:hypothetical protein